MKYTVVKLKDGKFKVSEFDTYRKAKLYTTRESKKDEIKKETCIYYKIYVSEEAYEELIYTKIITTVATSEIKWR